MGSAPFSFPVAAPQNVWLTAQIRRQQIKKPSIVGISATDDHTGEEHDTLSESCIECFLCVMPHVDLLRDFCHMHRACLQVRVIFRYGDLHGMTMLHTIPFSLLPQSTTKPRALQRPFQGGKSPFPHQRRRKLVLPASSQPSGGLI